MQLLPLIEHVPWIQELPASINLSMMESCVYITFIPSLSRFIPLQCFLYLCRPVDSYCQELLAASHSVHILNALASSCWPVSFVRFHTLLFRLFHSTHTNNANCPALYRSANLQTSSSFAKLNRWICDKTNMSKPADCHACLLSLQSNKKMPIILIVILTNRTYYWTWYKPLFQSNSNQ
jgi:hypothetical protein